MSVRAFHTLSPTHTFHQNALLHGPSTQLYSSVSSSTPEEILSTVRQALAEEGSHLEDWDASVDFLASFLETDNPQDAALCLATATSWKSWAIAGKFARKYIQTVTPTPELLQHAVTWLEEGPLALESSLIHEYIRQHPHIYLMEPDVLYKKALGAAPRKYRDPAVFRECILRDPTVLQVTYNCEDEGCAANCGSCWVTYSNRL